MNIVGKLIFLLRSIVVNTTHGSFPHSLSNSTSGDAGVAASLDDMPKESSPGNLEAQDLPRNPQEKFDSDSKLQGAMETVEVIPVQLEDQPRTRARYRRVFGLLSLAVVLPFPLAAVMGNWYPDAEHDAQKAKRVGTLRLVATLCGQIFSL